jgi:amino acid transporter
VLTVVGSAWVGIAAGLGHAQTVVWLLAFGTFYLPLAAAVYHLNREMPLEGGLYVWTRRAFGDTAGFLVAWRLVILFLQIRILGAASLIFTGVTRLPMVAGWDHLIPTWFSRLHPRYRTPTNSILVATVLVAALLVLASAGVRAAEAFAVLNNASNILYGLAYLVMFAIPLVGAKLIRMRMPSIASAERWRLHRDSSRATLTAASPPRTDGRRIYVELRDPRT